MAAALRCISVSKLRLIIKWLLRVNYITPSQNTHLVKGGVCVSLAGAVLCVCFVVFKMSIGTS